MTANITGLDPAQPLPDCESDALDNPGAFTGTISLTDDTITFDDTLTVTGASMPYSLGTGTYTLGSGLTGTTIGGASINYPNSIWTTSSDYSWQNKASAKIKLDGDDADIEVNGRSLMKSLNEIEQRLNILVPNPELESEWDELKRLGDRYRKLEKKIQDKMATWDRLKAMPKIDVD